MHCSLFRGWVMSLRAFFFLGLLSLCAASASAQQAGPPPPTEPALRIDPGMHTAAIRRVGVDAKCTLLATASEDKTVRLWHLPEGKLARTLRPPIGPGNAGKMNAVAVAPDASWIAAGGWDVGRAILNADYVTIFDPRTGAMAARLGPVSATIFHLAVSPDGRYLAATLYGGYGLRVWEKSGPGLGDWRLAIEDTDYGGRDAYGAVFDKAGTLYTIAWDGRLRRYAPGSSRPMLVATQGGQQPYSIAVHPLGDRLAVGYEDAPAADIYDAAKLTRRFAVETNGVKAANLRAVTWSADGSRFYATGLEPREGKSLIYAWKNSRQPPSEIGTASNSILHMLPCADGVALGTHEPALGLIAADGQRRVWREGVQADMRGQFGERGFSISADGRRVHFGLQVFVGNAVLFDVAGESLAEAPNRPGDLAGADTTSLPVTDWLHNLNPKVSGEPIKLDVNELARSLAVAPDRKTFVLGTEWTVRHYDRGGRLLWGKAGPGIAWGVNVSRDGKLVAVAYSDGTIRWRRLSDGEELLALFVHAQDRRWVAWTPKGYYMASPGAETLIGWHVNRGWTEAAHYFSVDRFREQFNRPDIVKLVLETLDEDKAIAAATKDLRSVEAKRTVRDGIATAPPAPAPEPSDVLTIAPPSVVIQSPGDNTAFRTQEVTLEYDVFSPTGRKITKVDYLINNAALGARFAPPPDTGKFTFSGRVSLPLPPEDVTITVVAYEDAKASAPASVRLRWDGAKVGQIALPRLRALFVGVNDYTSSRLNKLQYAAKDATDLAAFFKKQEGKSYSKVEVKALPNAKRVEVLNALEWLERESAEGDVNLLFLAGHGATIDQHFYYMAVDSDPESMRATAISKDEILRTIRNRKGSMVVMLDACHSGASIETTSGASRVDMNRLANELGDQSLGVLLYASARGRQFSFEHADWKNGAFTRAMLDGLAGGADRDKVGYVDTEELSVFVRRRVLIMTKNRQEPVRVKPDAAPEMKIVLLK
jgi:WD40 repeat protein